MIILDSLPTMTKQPLKKRYGAEFSCIEDILGYKTYIAACEGPFVGTSQKERISRKRYTRSVKDFWSNKES